MSTTTSPAPQPDVSTDHIIQTIFSVAGMAIAAMTVIPGVPAGVKAIIQTTVTDLHEAYENYTQNPSADVFDQVGTLITEAMADIRAILHP